MDVRGIDVVMPVKDVIIRRRDGLPRFSSLARVKDGRISELLLNDISVPCLNKLTDAPAGSIYRIMKNNAGWDDTCFP
jgi:hypothetical protein